MRLRTRTLMCAVLVYFWFSAVAQTQTGVTVSDQNPVQIATLHWYSADLRTGMRTEFPIPLPLRGACNIRTYPQFRSLLSCTPIT